MNISIVTSMYNRKAEVLDIISHLLLPSLLNNSASDIELIIIDDCSPMKYATETLIEKYLPALKRRFGNVIFVRNESNLGWTGSVNRGIFMAGGVKTIIANNDLYFPLNSIKRLAETLDDPKGYLIAGPITNNQGVWTFQYCRQAPTLKSYASAEIEKLEKFSSWLWAKMEGHCRVVSGLSGFCLTLNSTFLKKIGGFDEKYRVGYLEDADLIQRIVIEYGKKAVAANLGVFICHGGVRGASRTMLQQPFRVAKALIANSLKYANTWGYKKWIRGVIYGFRTQLTGKGTISELLPKRINL